MIASCQKCKKERYLYRDNMCMFCLAVITKSRNRVSKIDRQLQAIDKNLQKNESDIVAGINGSVRSLPDIEKDILNAYEKNIELTTEGRKIIDGLYLEKAKAKASLNRKNIWRK